MKEKTAMQILLKDLENFKVFPFVDKATINAAIDFTKLRLADEKKNLIDFYVRGCEDTYGMYREDPNKPDSVHANNYYSSKFKD